MSEVLEFVTSYWAFLLLMCSILCLTVFAALRKPLRTAAAFVGVAVSLWEMMR